MSVSGKSKVRSQTWVIRVIAILALLVSGISFAALEDEIRERLQPAGTVCVVGDACAASMATVATSSDAGGPKDPEQVYNTYCFACHATGVNDAPVLGNTEHWQSRIDKGMDALYENSIKGFNNSAMPPKGLCMDCSDEDLQAAVDFMVNSL